MWQQQFSPHSESSPRHHHPTAPQPAPPRPTRTLLLRPEDAAAARQQAEEACTAALQLEPGNTKALFRRARVSKGGLLGGVGHWGIGGGSQAQVKEGRCDVLQHPCTSVLFAGVLDCALAPLGDALVLGAPAYSA